MILTKNEYIWGVSVVSRDDGYAAYVAYYTDADDARRHAERVNGAVVQTTLWSDGSRWYVAEPHEVPVDAPTRGEVLAKLSDKERKVLGLS